MVVPQSRQRAKELVQNISKDHGYLDEEFLRTLSPDNRRIVEEALLMKDRMIGSSVTTLAKNLYTSKARFVFELLQNADDNSFTRAAGLGAQPYISFRVFPRKIIVECNEDGFTDENLKAICAVGKSSKSGSEGYIGEKGIGFKSVFMAAWKARIQSGAFSFSFRNDQAGMGMISPVWEDDFEELSSLLTRLTLYLDDTEGTGTQQNAHQIIQEQFDGLPETILLFMKNLRMIRVSFYNAENELETSSVMYSIQRPRSDHAVLKRTVVANNTSREHIKYFHLVSYQATNVPRHNNRTYPDGYPSTSMIMLAFPLSETSIPITEPQDVFAYLPVRPVGFKFIIQADFVTDASRQDIVRDSERNIALLNGVADAFCRAVCIFCQHGGLCLQWMRYLPDMNDVNWGTFWGSLVVNIADRLKHRRVLYCHRSFDLHYIRDLVRLRYDVYADEQPLFDDGDTEEIISQRYNITDVETLMSYGLQYANFGHIQKWLAADLRRGSQSRMKSVTTTDSWHTQAAKLLHLPFSMNWVTSQIGLKNMTLLPLRDGSWVSATMRPVYFASVDGIDIPPNIDLCVIDDAITNIHRKKLFEDLGVQTASKALIRRKILEVYEQSGRRPDISLQMSKRHLKFLYLTHRFQVADEPSLSNIVLLDQDECICKPLETIMYMATDRNPYTPWELLREVGSASSPEPEAPGFMMHKFMHDAYFEDQPQAPHPRAISWVGWLYRHLRIQKYVYFGDTDLSDAAKYLERKRPERFLGALRIHYHHNPHLSSDFIACVQRTWVLGRYGRFNFNRLKDAWFPTKRLESLVEGFVGRRARFPWIFLEGESSYDVIPEAWNSLLRKLGVGIPLDDLSFALTMLDYNVHAFRSGSTPESWSTLFSLYSYIQAQYRVEGGSTEAKTAIRTAFTSLNAICIPSADSNDWVSPEDCVWKAVQKLDTKVALQILYDSLPFLDRDSKRELEQLFSNTLGIPDCTLEIYVDELKNLQTHGSEDRDIICTLYQEIDRLWRLEIAQNMPQSSLRSQFEDNALIYVALNEGSPWRKISQCVWSTAARLRDMISLNEEYEELEDFFVNTLGVKPVTLSMAIDELKQAGSRQSISVEEVKASLLTVNSLLCSEAQAQQPGLMSRKIFPVRHPENGLQCVSVQTQFFIVDRESLRSSFEGQVKFLDFSLEEVVQLRPFISWAHLEDRYISRCVREFTSVQEPATHPISKHGHVFRHRAHAILRIAKHFLSPRTKAMRDTNSLYGILQNAKVFAADAICLELSVSQDGVSYKAMGGSMNIHLQEEDSNLTVYLPRGKVSQQHAFNKHLPERLLQWLMTEEGSQIRHETSDRAIIAIKDMWNTPLATFSTTLDECGIITINTLNVDPQIEEFSSDSESDVVSESATGHRSSSQAALHSEDSELGTNSEAVDTPPSASETSHNHGVDTSSSGAHRETYTSLVMQGEPMTLPLRAAGPHTEATPFGPSLNRDDEYLSVLERVIASTATSTIPRRNEASLGDLQGNVFSTAWRSTSRISGVTEFERDCKIGAAGELFVFELLSRLDPPLPNFSRANWQSTIRRYVQLHPEYASMSPWIGRETSDITYADTQGILTDFLIRNRYLDRDRWSGKTPHYFIEVKTTTLACDAPFFMSNAQYERMKDATLLEGSLSTIYVIFRVYQLHQSGQGPGLRVYVDPEALRLSGELNFTAPKWSVVPGENAF